MEEQKAAPAVANSLALEELSRIDSENTCLEELFRAMCSQTTADHQKLDFTQLSAALHSLKVNLAAVALDTFRAQSRPEELQLEDKMIGRQLWERIQQLFPDVREQRVAFLLLHCNLSPKDILCYAPQGFRDKQEICQLRRNILGRILLDSDHVH